MISSRQKISLLIFIQIVLLLASFVILTFYESQNTFLGNSVNVAGKNGFFVEEIELQISKYLLGPPFVGTPLNSLGMLNDNLNFLKTGGTLHGIEISPLPTEFDDSWDTLHDEYLNFAILVKKIADKKDAIGIISDDDLIEIDTSKNQIIELSDDMVNSLSNFSKTRSENLIMMQVIITSVNITTHIFLIIIIVRILKREFSHKVFLENKLLLSEEQSKNVAQKMKDEKLIVLGNFTSRLAHDMRNPLSIIRISLENIRSLYEHDSTQIAQFEKIDRSIDRMAHQIDDVLGFVKGTPSQLIRINFSNILTTSFDSINVPDSIEIIYPKNDVELICDVEQFSMAVNNLILNGIQAIDGEGTMEISLDDGKDEIVIEIKDSGKGIPADELGKVFEPMFTTKQQGTGLGLVSVKSIIELHGGIITVTSPPTVFRIILPKK